MVYIQKKLPYNSKYRNIKQTYNGITYDSKLEAKVAFELDLQKKAHNKHERVKSWERQVKISINVAWGKNNKAYLTDEEPMELKKKGIRFFHICNYFIDFVVYFEDGSVQYLEVKGMVMPVWQLKWKLTEALFSIMHPEIELKVIR